MSFFSCDTASPCWFSEVLIKATIILRTFSIDININTASKTASHDGYAGSVAFGALGLRVHGQGGAIRFRALGLEREYPQKILQRPYGILRNPAQPYNIAVREEVPQCLLKYSSRRGC